MFYPTPKDDEVATIAKSLAINASDLPVGTDKLNKITHATNDFCNSLGKIYALAKQQGHFHGSDIWGFFANGDVDIHCVREGYRNILIIVTDGYLYEYDNRIQNGDESNFITDPILQNPNAKLITGRTDSVKGDLEVLVLEVSPRDPKQLPHMKSLIEQWLTDLGVNKAQVWQTQLPSNTETVIKQFLQL